MEIKYPITIFLVMILIFIIFHLQKKNNHPNSSKIANTSYITQTAYYQRRIKEYHLILKIMQGACLIAILAASLLLARLIKIDTTNLDQYNRDIFLCMDVSASVDELNLELVNSLKKTVESLNGERFGISIFNSSSVTLVPLTEDYDYVLNVLNEIQRSIEVNNSTSAYTQGDYFYISNYIISGTQEGADLRGSSLIGDGLASCIYSFSNLEEERTRIIILSTDNDLAGNPYVTLSQAADISKRKNIRVFGIGTNFISKNDQEDFRNAMIKTGGKYYSYSTSTVKDIINDIENTSKSLLKTQPQKQEIDIPQLPFIILLLAITTLFILKQKVKK